jgi:putative nucleotidyltransferase with HDIG domain
MGIDYKGLTKLINTFPGMPGAAVKLLALVDDPDVSVDRIEAILRYDPGLTANLLRLANSAYFGMPSKVGSVRQAVILLGLKRMIQMVIASCMSAIMDQAVPGYDLPPGELWRHSIAVSVAAECLVKELNLDAAEEIFTAALLHDVGKLILGDFVSEDYPKIEKALHQGLSFEVAENIVLGTDHADVGAQILSKWSIPEAIIDAVRWHHSPESCNRPDTMLDIVHVANMLCLMIGIGVGRDGLSHQPSAVVVKRLGLETAHLEKVASQTLQWTNELMEMLQPA